MQTEEIQLDREDVILLVFEANERLLGRETFNGITRLEKLLFLLERETDFEGIGSFFKFEPHNFGPFSKEVYEALELLNAYELIETREKTYPSPYSTADELRLMAEISESDSSDETDVQATEKQFVLTGNGRKVAKIMREAVQKRKPSDVQELDRIVRQYGTWGLNRLIRYVYRQHPEMTEKSIHPAARQIHRR